MNVKFDFSDKIALVTGAATGMGKEAALQMAKAGATVIVVDFDAEKGKKAADECAALGVKSAFYQVDVSDETAVHAMAKQVLAEFGYIDFLVSNAGIGPRAFGPPLMKITPDDAREQFNVNTVGFLNMVQAFYDNFTTRKQGKIVVTASIAALTSTPLHPHYQGSKSAVMSYMKAIAIELGNFNINVNAILPGFVYTPIYHRAIQFKELFPGRFDDCETSEEVVAKMAANSALHRAQSEEDMAYGILFLCSDAAENITGQGLVIDSGRVIL